MAPVQGAWLRVDEAYAGQMALRRRLIAEQPEAVIACLPEATEAVQDLSEVVKAELPGLGYRLSDHRWLCPDGAEVEDGAGLGTLGRLCQSDFCLLQKRGDEHVLTAAVLCFPASWMLSEKLGQPLTRIHAPVAPYDEALSKRVQRLFDGVRAGRAIWRFNRLSYQDPALFQPRSEHARRDKGAETYLRAERQVVLRLPKTDAVLFAIHTYVVAL
jgi:hypothetical protein